MNKKTISTAAVEALKHAGKSLTPTQIFDLILEKKLYEFKAKEPLNILKSELRKHCANSSTPMRKSALYFYLHKDGSYGLLNDSDGRSVV